MCTEVARLVPPDVAKRVPREMQPPCCAAGLPQERLHPLPQRKPLALEAVDRPQDQEDRTREEEGRCWFGLVVTPASLPRKSAARGRAWYDFREMV